ncbi:MAG: GNAT family N-acetyltransferase [Ruminococcaceae bacterium]|nr:GNAT family N-acetyltransferase [Oscillospiraceae bacterium]
MIDISRTKKYEIPLLFALYRTAFPRSERKPFGKILRMAKEGRADLWTIRKNGRFAGLAATVNGSDIVLLDYFAVKKALRGQGVGSGALRQIEAQYADRGFFIEIESTFEDAANREQREKRKKFYANCGMIPMGTEADVFGIRMELLGVRCHLDFNDYREFYREHYSPWAAEHIREVL